MPVTRSFNPAAALATTRIYEENDYEFIVGEPSVFMYQGTNDDGTEKLSYGVGYPLQIAEGEFKGEKYLHNLWLHAEGADGMTKQFQMAALGYTLDSESEQRFNVEQANTDWNVDYDNKTCAEGWHSLKGHRVGAHLKIGVNKKTQAAQQQVKTWWPVA